MNYGRLKVYALWAVAVAAVFYGVARVLFMDRTEGFAKALVLQPEGRLDFAAVAGALASKFPDGTTVTRVQQFVVEQGGTCYIGAANFAGPEKDTLYCTVTLTAIPCVNTRIGIQARVGKGEVISSISSRPYTAAC
ncbi:MAG TPA: hypothetical protein VMZ74_10955 [Ramlibacter sp.]|nr:hypothetical protein [Ramlibacter sp.]